MSMQSSFARSRDPLTLIFSNVEYVNLGLSLFGFVFSGRCWAGGSFGTRFLGAVIGS